MRQSCIGTRRTLNCSKYDKHRKNGHHEYLFEGKNHLHPSRGAKTDPKSTLKAKDMLLRTSLYSRKLAVKHLMTKSIDYTPVKQNKVLVQDRIFISDTNSIFSSDFQKSNNEIQDKQYNDMPNIHFKIPKDPNISMSSDCLDIPSKAALL